MENMMNNIYRFVAIAVFAACMVSCGDVKKMNERIATAETAIAEQNYEAGKQICDDILGDKDVNELSASEYARLSVLYMHFYENDDDSEALDRAVDCYRQGMEINPDSVKSVFASLPVEDHKYAFALSMIVGNMDNPVDESEDNDPYVSPDSVGVVVDNAE